ncbi:hypothetical protein CBL_14258 [Carabus blaptoides fortunei]
MEYKRYSGQGQELEQDLYNRLVRQNIQTVSSPLSHKRAKPGDQSTPNETYYHRLTPGLVSRIKRFYVNSRLQLINCETFSRGAAHNGQHKTGKQCAEEMQCAALYPGHHVTFPTVIGGISDVYILTREQHFGLYCFYRCKYSLVF